MSHKERLGLTDTLVDALTKLSEGNPGALTTLLSIYHEGEKIDPDAVGGGLMTLLHVDSLGIYGPRIWMLYKDVCDSDIINVLGVLRAVQLGIISRHLLDKAIDSMNREEPRLDIPELLNKVREELPNFGKFKENS
jgi:hypothetical protein